MRARKATVPLVGRENEVAVLYQVVRRARHGGEVVILAGEAGIGKTRLVEAALEAARASGLTVMKSYADEFNLHRSLAPIMDLGEPSPEWRERLMAAVTAGASAVDSEGERQFRVAEALLDLLERRCLGGAVAVAIEDLQWADSATIGVLAQVAKGIETLPVVLIVSVRPHPRGAELERLLGILESRGATVVAVGPLDEEACAELVKATVVAHPGRRLLDQALRAGGNPLFITELLEMLRAGGTIRREGGMAEVPAAHEVPPLPITILHRLSFLPAEALELLGLASVLGPSFTAADLALLADCHVAQVVRPLRSASWAGVLREQGDRLEFRHALVREALYEDLPASVRRALHGAFARSLDESGEPPERMIEHLLRAAAPGDEASLASMVAAARRMINRGPTEALLLLRKAIELSGDPKRMKRQVLPDLAQALVSAGRLSEGEAACREALKYGIDPEVATALRLQLVMLLTRRPRTADALREAKQSLTRPGLGVRDRSRFRGWMALARLHEGDVDGGASDAEDLVHADDSLARFLAVDTLALAAGVHGRFTEAVELIAANAREVEAIGSREAYDSTPHLILGLYLARVDRLDDAYAAIQRGRATSEALGMTDTLASFHFEAAAVDRLRGRLDDAAAELAAHQDYAEQTGAGWSVPADSLRALIALHRGELLAADDKVAAAERAAAAGAPKHRIDLMVLARARLLEATGRAQAALESLAAAFETAQANGTAAYLPAIAPELARLAVITERNERAAGVVPALGRIAELNPGVRSLRAAALRAEGWLNGDPDALVAAAKLMRCTGRALESARVAEEAAAAISTRQVDEARNLLREAQSVYESSGATYDLARVEASLRALGDRRGVRGPRHRPASGWAALTPTEVRVAQLVCERLTNPEIAERMFISPRTVKTHVSHALLKLGVSTRRELATVAAQFAGWHFGIQADGGDAGDVNHPLTR